jgi:hypothetical protein
MAPRDNPKQEEIQECVVGRKKTKVLVFGTSCLEGEE